VSGSTIPLGFEVGTGKPISIPLRNTVIVGQTQEAGKTTTLEGLISRANLPAIAFVTKRGERSFQVAERRPPYFRERADWQFVASVLEATMRERLKFERAWIMRASKGARSLADVQANVRSLMEKAKGLSADVYMTLDEYLGIVVPRIERTRFAKDIELSPGVNVFDLSDRNSFPSELQALVMRSVLEWVYEHADGAITIIPEAWEYLPQGRGSPVKLAATELIRKGSGLRNYVWLDSQDIGGVDKELLRSCPVWLLGVQREANEIKRVLDNIPAGVAKPKASEVATLEKGQFFACFGRHVIKTYVQPAWMSPGQALKVALGELTVDQVALPSARRSAPIQESDMSASTDKKLDELIGLLKSQQNTEITGRSGEPISVTNLPPLSDLGQEEALYQRFKARLLKEPAVLKVLASVPEIEISETREVIEVDGKSVRGQIARLITSGFFDEVTNGNTVFNELKRIGATVAKPTAYKECDKLTSMGFLTRETDGYRIAPGAKARIKK
jgi:hypothetical protein